MLDQLDIFHGEATPHRALVYARLAVPDTPGRWSLDGHVRGPMAAEIRTLPASATLVSEGTSPTLLAKAVVTDPCGWSPETPVWYDVDVVLRRDGQIQARQQGRLAIRRLGIADRHFIWERRPWWLGAAEVHATSDLNPRAWGESGMSLRVTSPDAPLCDAATRWGIPLIADVAGDRAAVVVQLRRLARHPAITMAIVRHLPGDDREDIECPLRAAAPNLILIEPVDCDRFTSPASWAHAVVVPWDHSLPWPAAVADCPLPVIVSRRAAEQRTVAELRAVCDAWQAEILPLGAAGIIV